MIPIRLQMKNFMSYGEGVPPLDFTGMRLACLSGENGAGKTSILDAITWALWGETRAPSENDIIRLGATDCRVLFDFEVAGQRYRVHKARGRRGGSVWELQIWQEDGTPRSLSGTNARETKLRIQNLLRMDYKTFLASAYLAQGRADEFTRATVTERKKVLADILDLSRYERLEALAKERRGEAEAREIDAERDIRAIDTELAQEDAHAEALKRAEATLAAVSEEIESLQKDKAALAARLEYLTEREEKAQEYEAGIREREDEIAHNREALAESEGKLAAAGQILERRAAIEADHAAMQAIMKRIPPLEAQDREARDNERERDSLEREIEKARLEIENERYRVQCEIDNVERESADIGRLDAEIANLDADIQACGDPETARLDAERQRDDADKQFIDLKTENGTLKAQIDGLEKRLMALRGSDAPLCEYCGQSLSREQRHRAVSETEEERDRLRARQKDVAARGAELNALRDRLRKIADRAQADLRTVAQLRERRAQLSQQRLRLEERARDLPLLRDQFARHDLRLKERDYATEAQERLMQVSARLEKLERVAQELADARAERERLKDAERQFLLLERAQTILTEETQRAEKARAQIAKYEGQIVKAQALIAKIRQETEALTELRRDLQALAAQIQARQGEAQLAQREIGHRTSRLEHCAALKIQRAQRVEEQRAAAKEKDIYKELIGAFGKRGVQALIIENALPEIQDVANEILGKMTDGAMQVQLMAQREAKSKAGAAIETLDIIISDDAGTRPYEMYSGGEAFRINFALRIALSRMLAHRAGAALQTIILDEGFGTQDPRGRESIVDAINQVSDEFALILVITHIDELKDQFPTRIEVTKGEHGSGFTVV